MADIDAGRALYSELCEWIRDTETDFKDKPQWSKDLAHELCHALGFTSMHVGGAVHVFTPPYTEDQLKRVDGRYLAIHIPPEAPLGGHALKTLYLVIREWSRVTGTPL